MSNVKSYDVGKIIRCKGTFKNESDALHDPTDVYFELTKPDNTVVTYHYGVDAQVVRDSLGKYHVLVDGNVPGYWYYKFYATGTGQASDSGSFVTATLGG